MIILGFFLFPIAEFQYILAAAKSMFLARTRDPDLLLTPEDSEPTIKPPENLDPTI